MYVCVSLRVKTVIKLQLRISNIYISTHTYSTKGIPLHILCQGLKELNEFLIILRISILTIIDSK